MVFIPPRHARIRRSIRRSLRHQERIATLLRDEEACGRSAPSVSEWTVGMQLEHIGHVDHAVLEAIDRLRDDDGEGGRPTLPGRILMITGRIPRGRAKAPAPSRPRGIETAEVARRVAENRRRFTEHLDRVRELARLRKRRPHPILGNFDVRQWFRFLDIHERHHLKIIDDILRSSPR